MGTKLGIMSDPHATPGPVEEALSIFQQEEVEYILCAGDIAGYGEELDKTVNLLLSNGCVSVIGNHEAWFLDSVTAKENSDRYRYLNSLPDSIEMTIEGMHLYMVHASPPHSLIDGIKLLNEHGELLDEQFDYWSQRLQGFSYNLLIVGHSHQAFSVRMADTLVINPGSTLFNHSCAVLTMPELRIEWFSLSGQPLQKSWNWGMSQRASAK